MEIEVEFWKQVKGFCLYAVWIGDRCSVVRGDNPANPPIIQEKIAQVECALLYKQRITYQGDYLERELKVLFTHPQSDRKAAKDLCRRLLYRGGRIVEFELADEYTAVLTEQSPM